MPRLAREGCDLVVIQRDDLHACWHQPYQRRSSRLGSPDGPVPRSPLLTVNALGNRLRAPGSSRALAVRSVTSRPTCPEGRGIAQVEVQPGPWLGKINRRFAFALAALCPTDLLDSTNAGASSRATGRCTRRPGLYLSYVPSSSASRPRGLSAASGITSLSVHGLN